MTVGHDFPWAAAVQAAPTASASARAMCRRGRAGFRRVGQCHTIPTRGPATPSQPADRPAPSAARSAHRPQLRVPTGPATGSASAKRHRVGAAPARLSRRFPGTAASAGRAGDTAAVWTEAAPVKSKTRWRVQSRACEVKDALARSLDAPKVRWLVSPSLPLSPSRSGPKPRL